MKKKEERVVVPNKQQDKKMIYTIAAIFIIIFGVLIGNFIYFTIFKTEEMSVHPQNTRLNRLESEVIRGNIYDASKDQVLLATTNRKGERRYPYNTLYAHLVGYCQKGKIGAEALGNIELMYPSYTFTSILKMLFFNQKFHGRDVVLTADHRYQEALAKGMEGKKGAAIVLEASTGKILGMYSNPNFNPNEIQEQWQTLTTDQQNTPLINRATGGLYPPGSIFKVITTLAYMESSEQLDFTYDCSGGIAGRDGDKKYTIKCSNGKVHGEVDLFNAFAKSCNGYFIALSRTLPEGALRKTAQQVGFNRSIPTEIGYRPSRFSLTAADSSFEKDATAIGQGKTLTNPFEMAWLAAAIVNDGIAMKPYLIQYSMNEQGQVKEQNEPEVAETIMSQKNAQGLQKLMEGVLDKGTAISLPEKGLVVGGKTGTAQNETKADHSWFMGYAKNPDNPEHPPIAFAVIVEGGGKGAQALKVSDDILKVYRKISK